MKLFSIYGGFQWTENMLFQWIENEPLTVSTKMYYYCHWRKQLTQQVHITLIYNALPREYFKVNTLI